MPPKKQALDLDKVFIDKRDGSIYDPRVPRTTKVEVASPKFPAHAEQAMRKEHGVGWDKLRYQDKAMYIDRYMGKTK